MTRIYKCNYCGIEDTAAADEYRLQKCTGCNSSKQLYCSRQCQKLDWPSHKNRCRRKANHADMLVAKDKQLFDMDRLMSYASRYMHNLKHVHLSLSEYCIVGNNIISSNIIQSFLRSNAGQLDSLTFDWEMDISSSLSFRKSCAVCMSATNGGKIWTELRGLKLLDMKHPIFSNCKDLIKVINQQRETIEALELISIEFGLNQIGTRNDWSLLLQRLANANIWFV